jgi:hypothetical protein
MSIHFPPTLIPTLGAPFGRRLLEQSRPDSPTAFEAEYVLRVGYRLGPAGEWIALDPSSGRNNRPT